MLTETDWLFERIWAKKTKIERLKVTVPRTRRKETCRNNSIMLNVGEQCSEIKILHINKKLIERNYC